MSPQRKSQDPAFALTGTCSHMRNTMNAVLPSLVASAQGCDHSKRQWSLTDPLQLASHASPGIYACCSDGDWRKAKEGGRQPEPTREWQQHGVGNPARSERRSDGGGGVWDDEPSAGAPRPRMTPAEMEEERKRMQEEFRNRKQAAVTHVDQGVRRIAVIPLPRAGSACRWEPLIIAHVALGPGRPTSLMCCRKGPAGRRGWAETSVRGASKRNAGKVPKA